VRIHKRPPLILLTAALVGLGCREPENRPAESAHPQDVSDPTLLFDELAEIPAKPEDLPDLVPEFRLRLDPGANTIEARIELDAPQADSLHMLFRTEWEGYPGLEERLRKIEAWSSAGGLPVEEVMDGLGPGHRRIAIEQPGHVTIAYSLVLAPRGDSRFYHRVSQLAPDGGHLLGNDVLPRIWLGRPRAGAQPATLWFTGLPANWRVATVEPRAGTGYDVREILNAVFVVGPLRSRRLNIGQRSLAAAIYGRWPVRDDRVVDAVNRIAGSLHRIAGDGWSPGRYLLGAGRVPAGVPGLSTGGQVIGRSGIVYVGGTGPAEVEFQHWMYTTAHELMHWYIPTAFAFEVADPPAWFAEGFTDYMALKVLLVGNLIEPAEFLTAIGERLARYRASLLYGHTSVSQAQESFWEENSYRYIYDGGAVAAFLLDLGFQDRGGSLERALRELQRQRPVGVETVTATLAAVRENDWIHDWLDTGANPDYEARFSQYGLALTDGALISLNNWTTDALSSIKP